MSDNSVPVIAIDGPSGSGKGTICQLVADELGFHLLDSGALYRLVGLAAKRHGLEPEDTAAIAGLARKLDVRFEPDREALEQKVWLEGDDVSLAIRTDEAGQAASRVAVIPEVRSALLERQREFRQAPGLVADGRDMGTVVFPDAPLKIFLTASAEERARRRFKQLQEKGVDASLSALLESIVERDERDRTRDLAPLVPAAGAFVIDTSGIGIQEVFGQVVEQARKIQ